MSEGRRAGFGWVGWIALLAAAGCHRQDTLSPDPLTEGCRSCHGDRNSSAPPVAIDGSTDTKTIGVGAHQTHVLGGALQRPVACSECHVVPKHPDDPGHMDHPLPAYVLWGPLAKTGSVSPAWDRKTATCANTYCHGTTLTGGSNTTPIWTVVDGSQSACGSCHGLPPPAPHPPSKTCESCHAPVAGPNMTIATPDRHADGILDVATPDNVSDPAHNIVVHALIPSYSGTSISALTPSAQTLTMPMNHKATAVPPEAFNACGNCHMGAATGEYKPGLMHASLKDMKLTEPTHCTECHSGTRPNGFVGTTVMTRTPPSGEMKHDAVLWANGAPTTMPVVPADCGTCHQASGAPTWDSNGGAKVKFHASLGPSAQPSSCLDCHANSRPSALLTSANSSMPAGLTFDHQSPQALDDCQTCHAGSAPGFTAWSGGRFHKMGAAVPSTCLPCHEGERPASTQGWMSTTYKNSPFDYTSNALNITHGAGQDCADCHSNAGTGQWGMNQNWAGGHFSHGPSTLAATTCINCHTTQRPDLLPGATAAAMAMLLGFDHSIDGRGDCVGCHQATVRAGNYVDLYNPSTGTLPSGDWKGGIGYPGSFLVSSTTHFIATSEIVLVRSGPNNLVTGTSQRTSNYPNAFLHTSTALPAAVNAGPTGNPDNTKCWHCHANTNGMVTSFSDGVFHASLTNYRATVGGPITPLAQPTVCRDCHTARPRDIVELGGSTLVAMDHSAAFTAAVSIGGAMASGAFDLDCAVCHQAAGQTSWADGVFHANIASAIPADCTSCHYPLMADGAKADVTSAGLYRMQHRSGQLTIQKCDTCHGAALQKAAMAPAAGLWQTGALHASLSTQPAQCAECHTVALPMSSTQGSVTYSLAQGGTPSNQAQWMNHASSSLAGKDCAACHASDAGRSVTSFSKATKFHAAVGTVTTCRECHGLTNGQGSTVGTNNNLPSGLTNASAVTSADATTGVPSGTHDQVSHTDVNVTANDCSLCHTQQGPSSTAPVMGKEWAQAGFHQAFSAASPLVLNGSTGRCSNCHLNVKPTSAFTQFDHAPYTATSQQDCSGCHSWPGNNPSTPNWLGAAGEPHATSGPTQASTLACDTCHGPGGSATTHLNVPLSSHYQGISNGNTCISCHPDFSGFKGTITNTKYAHANASANSGGCEGCHQYASQLYTTLTTTPLLQFPTTAGGHQFSQSYSVTARNQTSTHTDPKFTNCGACHQYSTTTAATTVWTYKHDPSNPGISNRTSSNGCNWCH